MLTLQNLQKMWPNADHAYPGLIEGIATAAPVIFPKYGLTSDLVIAHAMAQFSVESGQGTSLIENLNYSAQRLLQVFPTHFNAATAAQYAHNPLMIGEIAYGGRLGNAPAPSTDGYVYRGAGLIQVTGKGEPGKSGVVYLQEFLDKNNAGFDIVAHPGLLLDPSHALECGVAEFVNLGCLPFAQKDDVKGVTLRVNGGLNGFPQRQQQLALWKTELGVPSAVSPLDKPGTIKTVKASGGTRKRGMKKSRSTRLSSS